MSHPFINDTSLLSLPSSLHSHSHFHLPFLLILALSLLLSQTQTLCDQINDITESFQQVPAGQLSEEFKQIISTNHSERCSSLADPFERELSFKTIQMIKQSKALFCYVSNPQLSQMFFEEKFFHAILCLLQISQHILALNQVLSEQVSHLIILQNQIIVLVWKILFNFMSFHVERDPLMSIYIEVIVDIETILII